MASRPAIDATRRTALAFQLQKGRVAVGPIGLISVSSEVLPALAPLGALPWERRVSLLPFQAPTRRFIRLYGATLYSAVSERGLDEVAAVFAERVTSPGSETPAHVRRLLGNLAQAYSASELRHQYAVLIASCLPPARDGGGDVGEGASDA